MKTIIKEIPEGIKYLSDWEGFNHLPKHEHYILAKEICGCGATEAFIKSNEPLIIAMPRKHLLSCISPSSAFIFFLAYLL